jgi:hypothetical protein
MVHSISASLDGSWPADKQEPGLPDDRYGRFIGRLFFALPGIVMDWIDLAFATQHTGLGQHVLSEQRSTAFEASKQFTTAMDMLLEYSVGLYERNPKCSPEGLMDPLVSFEQAAIDIISSFKIPGSSHSSAVKYRLPADWMKSKRPKEVQSTTLTTRDLETLHLQRAYARLVSSLLPLRAALARILAGHGDDSPKTGNAARRRRYRLRQRRRVAFPVQIDIYDDDIQLLRHCKLISAQEKQDQTAVTSAIESMLLFSFFTYPESLLLPWHERVLRQWGRITAIPDV